MVVRNAFAAAGVPLIDAFKAAEHFCRRFQLNTELGDDDSQHRVTVADGFGEIGVEDAVQAFLVTGEGGLFSPAPKKNHEGPVMARLRQLRARMQ